MSMPNTTLSDCLNGTLITDNGNEFTLQTDFGNGKVETASLKPGFIPLGTNELDGIVYVVSYNPLTNETEFGSFPSPERNFSTYDMNSNDPMATQGIGSVNFTNTDFAQSGSIITTKVKRDLLNFTKFKLSPGDKYIVYYVDQVGWDSFKQYLSTLSKRKLFKIKIMRVSESGISEIRNSTIFSETEANMTEDVGKFSVFTENTSGGIGILLELETIDYFQVSIAEKIDTANLDVRTAKITINSKFESDVKLYGFRLQIRNLTDTLDSTYDKYISIPASVGIENKERITFNLELNGFLPMNEYEFTFTPYSQYNMYDSGEFAKFVNKLNFTFGKVYTLEENAFESKTFKYFVDDDDVTITFDSYLNTANTIASCYIEFYDTWSNTSTIVKANDHENGIQTTVVVPFSTELLTQTFNNDDIGGIKKTNLKTLEANYAENEFLKAVLPTVGTQYQDNYVIKADGKLRKNAFYVVRISLVEVITDGETATVNYYDVYRCMKTTQETNDYFTDPNVINMSAIDSENIKFKINEPTQDISYPQINEIGTTYNDVNNFTPINNKLFAYKISNTQLSISEFKINKQFKCTTNYKCIYDIDNSNFVNLFGIKNNVNYTTAIKGISDNGEIAIDDVISVNGDAGLIDNVTFLSDGKLTNVNIKNEKNKITIDLSLLVNTTRSCYATAKSDIIQITTVQSKTIWDTFNDTLKNSRVLLQMASRCREDRYGVANSNVRYQNATTATWDSNGYLPIPKYMASNNKSYLAIQEANTTNGDIRAWLCDFSNTATTGCMNVGWSVEGGNIDSYALYNALTGIDTNISGVNIDVKSGFVAALYSTWATGGGTLSSTKSACLPLYKASKKPLSFLQPDKPSTNFSSLCLLMPFKDSAGKFGFGIVPNPIVPESGVIFTDYTKLIDSIRNFFTKIGTSKYVDTSYMVYTPDSIIYNDNSKTTAKLSELNITLDVNVEKNFATSMIFKALGNDLINTDIAIVKNYINSKISVLGQEFKNMEILNNDVTTKISNKYFPVIAENKYAFDVKLDDFDVTIDQNKITSMSASMTQASAESNNSINKLQDINIEVGNVVAFDKSLSRYVPYFKYDETNDYFYYVVGDLAGKLEATRTSGLYKAAGDFLSITSSLMYL